MSLIKDWHFWVVLVAVLLALVPQFQQLFPGQVIWKILVILLGGAAMFLNQYNQKQAFIAGSSSAVGSAKPSDTQTT